MPRSLSSSRMEAFSDGVFSIAATLLVLDIALHPPGTPLEQLRHAWPAYLGDVISLLTIRLLGSALDWYARHERLYSHDQADEELQTDRRKLWPVVVGYVVAILIGVAAPTAGVMLYLVLAVYIVVPFRDLRRLAFTRS